MDRLSIACHRDTPVEYLTKLTEDEDLRVREVAQKTMQHMLIGGGHGVCQLKQSKRNCVITAHGHGLHKME